MSLSAPGPICWAPSPRLSHWWLRFSASQPAERPMSRSLSSGINSIAGPGFLDALPVYPACGVLWQFIPGAPAAGDHVTGYQLAQMVAQAIRRDVTLGLRHVGAAHCVCIVAGHRQHRTFRYLLHAV